MDDFNLLTAKWIPVLFNDGTTERLGITETFLQAGRIREIAASNPMDRVALIRFLLALLYWCKGNPADGSFAISDENENKTYFNLLGDGRRFMQDEDVWKEATIRAEEKAKHRDSPDDEKTKTPRDKGTFRPVGDLLQEFPVDSKVIHFRHVQNYKYGLCRACCAMGLVRFCAFASAYAQVFPAGLNGPTPAYAIPTGSTLQETLRLNWSGSGATIGLAGFCDGGKAAPAKDIGAVTAFTWQPRRIWLGELGDKPEACAYCGKPERIIRRIAFGPGWKSPFTGSGKEKKFWPGDPHLLLAGARKAKKPTRKSSQNKAPEKTNGQPIGFPPPNLRVGIHASFWRTAAKVAADNAKCGKSLQVMGPAANKALYQDSTAITVPAVTHDAAQRLGYLDNIRAALPGMLQKTTVNPQRRHPNRFAALDAFSASLESKLNAHGIQSPSEASANEFAKAVRRVVLATTGGSPLHRRQSLEDADRALQETMEKAKAQQP